MKFGWMILLGPCLAGCIKQTPPSQEHPAKIHYVREAAWHGDGVWFYPTDTALPEQTGLATVYPSDTEDQTTTDGEVFDQQALAAAHQTVPLPAILRVTNLENGRQILVRANDRGPTTPHRLIELTARAAERLGIDDGHVAEVRVAVEDGPTAAMTEKLGGGAPKLDIATAPVGDVRVEDLGTHRISNKANEAGEETQASFGANQAVPDQLWQATPSPMPLWVEGGTFSQFRYAQQQRIKIGGALVQIGHGRTAQFQVRLGPFGSVSEADAALDRAIGAGVTDARIIAALP